MSKNHEPGSETRTAGLFAVTRATLLCLLWLCVCRAFAPVRPRQDDLEAAASTDSEVASTASSTGGASSVCSGDSSRSRARDRDLSLELCSNWSEEGEEDVLLGLSLARAR